MKKGLQISRNRFPKALEMRRLKVTHLLNSCFILLIDFKGPENARNHLRYHIRGVFCSADRRNMNIVNTLSHKLRNLSNFRGQCSCSWSAFADSKAMVVCAKGKFYC